jgi:DNA polymerase
MHLSPRQLKILTEMGLPVSGFSLRERLSSNTLAPKSIAPKSLTKLPFATLGDISSSSSSLPPTFHPPTSLGALPPIPTTSPARSPAQNEKVVLHSRSSESNPNAKPGPNLSAHPSSIFKIQDAEHIASLDWQTLREEALNCQSCALSRTRKRVCFGHTFDSNGPASKSPSPLNLELDAKHLDARGHTLDWLVIDHGPSDLEDQSGNPFLSEAGTLLANILKAMSMHNQALRIGLVNVLKCHTPGGRLAQAFEVSQCKPYLHRQIELLRPKAILILGHQAFKLVFANMDPELSARPFVKIISEVHTYAHTPVFVTYHPQYLLAQPKAKAKAWQDLCKAQATLDSQE